MCGFVGILGTERLPGVAEDTLRRMTDTLRHRGPDDSGIWLDQEAGIQLGHRRLSVIDLSADGHQPMLSQSGRYVIAFNGEIYNFQRLRVQLEPLGHRFRGHSDTEVILAAVEQWGLVEALRQFVGMFAFALWDRHERALHLARDRLGEKPLYYGSVNGVFLFGSELKALRAHPYWQVEVDRDALALFLRHNYVPAPYSIYKGVYKLSPGTVLTVKSNRGNRLPAPLPYWSARTAAESGVSASEGSTQDAADELDQLLRGAVLQQMVADVPLGAFLSGGIDSSTVVALMQAQSAKAVKTFTIGFFETEYNEAEAAKAVAQHLGTDHTELYVTPKEAIDVIPELPSLYDEPFADSSQIPTYLVARLARQRVTVSLSGDGGDELFGGYHRYFLARRIWKRVQLCPLSIRRVVARAITTLPPERWDRLLRRVAPLVPGGFAPGLSGDRAHKLAEILSARDAEEMYTGLISHWKQPASVVIDGAEPATALTMREHWPSLKDFTQRMMYVDLVTYLPDDILVKVDRASMAVSLESRVPFLDHRVVEFAWRVPLSMKIRQDEGKWLLRQVLYRYVPRELIERPKMGFGVPIDSWLRGPLREWGEAYLAPDRLVREGFFNPGPIRQKWFEHLSGKRDWQYYLWNVLMFQAWLAEQKDVHAHSRMAASA